MPVLTRQTAAKLRKEERKVQDAAAEIEKLQITPEPENDENAPPVPLPLTSLTFSRTVSFSRSTTERKNDKEYTPPSACPTVYHVQFNPLPPLLLLGRRRYKYLLALVMGDRIALVKISGDGKHWDRLTIRTETAKRKVTDSFDQPAAKRLRGRSSKRAPVMTERGKENRLGPPACAQPPKTGPAPRNRPIIEESIALEKLHRSAESSNEDLHVVQWIKDPQTLTIWSAFVVGGRRGTIRFIDLCSGRPRWGYAVGHTGPITCFGYSENHPKYLLSAAMDHTIRLWSVRYFTCLAIFKGLQGHTRDIFTMDMHPSGRFFASGAYEYAPNKGAMPPWRKVWCLKIWNLFDPDNVALQNVIMCHGIQPGVQPAIISSPVYTKLYTEKMCCVRWVRIEGGSEEYLLVCKFQDEIIVLGRCGTNHTWIPKYRARVFADGDGFDWLDQIRDPVKRLTKDRTLRVINMADWSDVKQQPENGESNKSPDLMENCYSSHPDGTTAVVSGTSELTIYTTVRDEEV